MIPSFEVFFFPVLNILGDGKPWHRDALRDACAKYMGFSEEDLQERVNSGLKLKITDRLHWSTFYLIKAGLLMRVDKATEQITEAGKELLAQGIDSLNRQYLREHYQAYRYFEQETREASKRRELMKRANKLKANAQKQSKKAVNESNDLVADTSTEIVKEKEVVLYKKTAKMQVQTVETRLSAIHQEVEDLTNGLIDELKGIVSSFDKQEFKNLLLELFPKMGYSSQWEDCALKAKMEHAVNLSGFLNFDELGLNKIFVIAHNNPDEEISSLDVQSFIGTLTSLAISHGLYITTSTFSAEAIEWQLMSSSTRCVLIDGVSLAKLMIKYNIGVVVRKVFEVKDVDTEYLFTHLSRSSDQ